MKDKEIDLDDYPDEVFKSEKAFLERFRPLESQELIDHRRRIAKARAGPPKSRVTIYLDGDVISSFKDRAAKENVGYQTLINDALRQLVDAKNRTAEQQSVKDDLLTDKKFLKKLRAALAA
jgi:uncharacterized protein (DUF4415 family)